mmetsp:Transcript_21673/g.46918  ORF Transcript_21673/g.46918 Transcript_21673/m.46918 type:complete len:217 (-) Transcript_21673:1059-1709(-)
MKGVVVLLLFLTHLLVEIHNGHSVLQVLIRFHGGQCGGIFFFFFLQRRRHTVRFLVPFGRLLNALFEGVLALVSQQSLRLAHIGTRVGDISRLIGQDLDNGLASHMLLHQTDKLFERRSTAFSQVEDFVGMRTIQGTNNALDNVINVGVVAAAGSISKLLNLHSPTDAVDKLKGGHVGASAGPVDGEEAECRNVEIVQVVVGIGQQLASLFGGGVG